MQLLYQKNGKIFCLYDFVLVDFADCCTEDFIGEGIQSGHIITVTSKSSLCLEMYAITCALASKSANQFQVSTKSQV